MHLALLAVGPRSRFKQAAAGPVQTPTRGTGAMARDARRSADRDARVSVAATVLGSGAPLERLCAGGVRGRWTTRTGNIAGPWLRDPRPSTSLWGTPMSPTRSS